MLTKTHVSAVGLIGGSIAKALTESGASVSVWDRDPSIRELAVAAGLVCLPARESNADLFVIGAPISAVPEMVTQIKAELADKTCREPLLIDVASVQFDSSGRYFSTHPLAGRADSGFANSDANLFLGATWAVPAHKANHLPTTRPRLAAELSAGLIQEEQDLRLIKEWVSSLGALPVSIDAVEHNRAVASYSHLVQILASALAGSTHRHDQAGLILSGPAFRDATRVAASAPEMWQEIFKANQAEVSRSLRDLITELQSWQRAVDNQDSVQIAELIGLGNQARADLVARRWPE